jgi:hypothetical protein
VASIFSTPNLLCDHNLVMNRSLWTLWHEIWWLLDCFNKLLLFMFRFDMSNHLDILYSIKLGFLGSIQIWECALNCFIMEPVQERMLDISHLCSLGTTYPKDVFFFTNNLNPYVQMISKWYGNLQDIQTQHIINVFHWRF